jgi:hypothetical protein
MLIYSCCENYLSFAMNPTPKVRVQLNYLVSLRLSICVVGIPDFPCMDVYGSVMTLFFFIFFNFFLASVI